MAKATLPTNFKDDVLADSMGGKRRYRLVNNSDGTVSLEDVTTYTQEGSIFGQAQVNATNQAVNASFDASKLIADKATVMALTQAGYAPDALLLKELNSDFESLGGFTPVIDSDTGEITGYKTTAGADTVFPFSSIMLLKDYNLLTYWSYGKHKTEPTDYPFILDKDMGLLVVTFSADYTGNPTITKNGVDVPALIQSSLTQGYGHRLYRNGTTYIELPDCYLTISYVRANAGDSIAFAKGKATTYAAVTWVYGK